VIVSYLPEPTKHPLWNDILRLIERGTDEGVSPLEDNELVWIAFEGQTLFAAGTIALIDGDAWLLAVGGFEHRRWLETALEVAANWARDCGSKRLRMRGRRGWARSFRALGWDCSQEGDKWLYTKELSGGQD
jgi:hypothetical protein